MKKTGLQIELKPGNKNVCTNTRMLVHCAPVGPQLKKKIIIPSQSIKLANSNQIDINTIRIF